MQMMSKVYAHRLVEWAKNQPQLLVLSADLTSSVEVDLFRQTYPDRFYSMGLTEQNMIGVAGGLAREGFSPWVHTFAVFLYRRTLDQIIVSIAYPNLPVRLVGFLPGITTPGGMSHQAIEDVAILRAIPNMTILEVGDVTEIETVLDAAQSVNGPLYLRMLRGEVPRLFSPQEPFQFNHARELSKGNDIALLSSGICTEEAMRATSVLQQHGISIRHLHISTLKPFTDPAVLDAIASAKMGVITMENHTIIGGLGSAVAELIAENGLAKKLVRIGLRDTFAHGGSRPYLMKYYGLDAMALVTEVEKMAGCDLNIQEHELQAVRLETVHSAARAEAL